MSKKSLLPKGSLRDKPLAPKSPSKPAQPKIKKTQSDSNAIIKWILCAAILITTFIVYNNTFTFDFTNWDDPTYVTENPMMSTEELKTNEIFKDPISLNYHPITMLTLAWNYKLEPQDYKKFNIIGIVLVFCLFYFVTGNVWFAAAFAALFGIITIQTASTEGEISTAIVYHKWNAWIHVFNTVLVFFFIFLLSGSTWAAAFTAAVFGLHPMHVESVAWISERKDVLYSFFFLLSCISYVKFRLNKKWIWYGLCATFFVLSVLSKAVAVVLPLVLILIDYYLDKKIDIKKQWDKIPLLAFSLAMGIVAYNIQSKGAIADEKVFTLFQRLMFGSYGAVMYLVKFFYPTHLSAFYPYPTLDQQGDIPFYFYLAPLIWLVIVGLMWWGYKKFKPLTFGLAFFIVTVVLVLQFLSVGTAIMADRYSYIPYIGIAFAIAMLLERAAANKSSYKIPAMALCGVFAIVLAMQAKSRVEVWKNSDTLWTDVIEKYPREVEVAYKNRGNYWGKEKGDAAKAYENYVVLKHMNSKDTKVYSNMGNVYAMRKQGDSAMWAYTKAIELDPKNEEAFINRGITYAMMKQYDKAVEDFNKAEQISGPTTSVLQNRAYSYLASGQNQKALADYNQLLMQQPNNAQAYYYRGLVREQLGQREEALQDVRQAAAMGFKVDAAVMQRLGGS